MNWVPYAVLVVIIGGLVVFSTRARRRQVEASLAAAAAITVGDDVMTTSGLYGTVVDKRDDGTAVLRIATGVEVRWEVAALRPVTAMS